MPFLLKRKKNNIQVSNFDLILPFNQREKVS